MASDVGASRVCSAQPCSDLLQLLPSLALDYFGLCGLEVEGAGGVDGSLLSAVEALRQATTDVFDVDPAATTRLVS